MNIEDYRNYCLSLGDDVEERMPFKAFRYASEVLVFYVYGHMFSFFDCNNFSVVTLKCQPDRIEDLKERHSCIGKPFNSFSMVSGAVVGSTPIQYRGDSLTGLPMQECRSFRSSMRSGWHLGVATLKLLKSKKENMWP